MLAGVTSVLLDTAPVIYYVERHPVYAPALHHIFQRIDAGTLTAITTPVTLAECLVLPVRSAEAGLQARFRATVTAAPHTRFVAIDGRIAATAAELRARYNCSLLDALQAAAINESSDALLTNDAGLRRIAETRVLLVDDLVTAGGA